MKIIFLDFDGVLCNAWSFRHASGLQAMADPKCIAALNRITDATGAKIVVSSTWRIGQEVIQLRELLKGWGATAPVIDRTPLFWAARGLEIAAWLKDYTRETIEAFVILDDDGDMVDVKPHLVQTVFSQGLTQSDADRAIGLLRRYC